LQNQGTGSQLTEKKLRILVVDDNKDAADSLCMLLRAWGYDCQAVYDGNAGLHAACDYRPDCLVLDINMPGLDGCTLARRVRAQPSLEQAKLIALTAYSDETHVRLAQEAGFDYHVVKSTEPREIERLMDTLNEMVRLAYKAEEMTRQNVAVASEAKELLKEVKEDMKEVKEEVKELKTVKEDIKEIKEEVKDLKVELREIKEARAEEHPGDGTSSKPGSQAEE
jgi:two-component system, OmpR family, response regulator